MIIEVDCINLLLISEGHDDWLKLVKLRDKFVDGANLDDVKRLLSLRVDGPPTCDDCENEESELLCCACHEERRQVNGKSNLVVD